MNAVLKVLVLGGALMVPSVCLADRHHHHDSHFSFGIGLNLYPDRYYYDPFYYPVYDPYYPPVVVQQAPLLYQPVAYADAGAPVQVTAPQATAPQDSYTVNIPNSKGGYTAVVLKRTAEGYTGPQGELYKEFPKVAQLQAMYGN